MIITEIPHFSSKIIRFQVTLKSAVEFTCALEFKISSQRKVFSLARQCAEMVQCAVNRSADSKERGG